jgi:hypothetical protein
MQLLDLANGDRAIRAFQHAFNKTALGVARAIRKLWHATAELIAQFGNNLAKVISPWQPLVGRDSVEP